MFDIKKILLNIYTDITMIAVGQIPAVQFAAVSYFKSAQQTLTDLATYFINGDISKKFLEDRLLEEKDIFLTELLSFAVITKEVAQEVVNKVQKDFVSQLNALIPQNNN